MRAANRPARQARSRDAEIVAALGFLVLLATAGLVAARAPEAVPQSRVDGPPRAATGRQRGTVNAARRRALPSDDWTYRPTVVIRRGTSQGSGTIIASVDGETLVLTAAHVVRHDGPVLVELHRYNLGLEHQPATAGVWPRVMRGALAANDTAADLAIVHIQKMAALPYVARLARGNDEPPPDSIVNSVGVDLGSELTSWSTRLLETVSFELNDSHGLRPFLITEKIPEHGRSGGGLFLAGGELVGVCIGHAELEEGRPRGVFAAGESIRRLLDDHKLTAAVLRSEKRMARLKQVRSPAPRAAMPARSNSAVTPTRSLSGRRPSTSAP